MSYNFGVELHSSLKLPHIHGELNNISSNTNNNSKNRETGY